MARRKVSQHISINDSRCNDGCGLSDIQPQLILMAETFINYLSSHYDKKVVWIWHCICRCERYNKEVGGKPGSQHLKGGAGDGHAENLTIEELHQASENVHFDDHFLKGGLGFYPWGIHIDTGRFRTWGNKLT